MWFFFPIRIFLNKVWMEFSRDFGDKKKEKEGGQFQNLDGT